jgi:hypothetical protein
MPTAGARFVIVGLTDGPGFHRNPCLSREVAWVRRHDRLLAAYAMTTYPPGREVARHDHDGPYAGRGRLSKLRNTGYAEATYNVRRMRWVGIEVPMVWVDVEPYRTAPWSHHHRANRAVLSGVIRGYEDADIAVGIYTYSYGWRAVTGGWRLPGLPTWVSAGRNTRRAALAMCHHGPPGGRTWIAQHWGSHRDRDATCPGIYAAHAEDIFSPSLGAEGLSGGVS